MLIPKITGTMIRAGRSFAHLSQDQLADRAGTHRRLSCTLEGSSDSVPGGFQVEAKHLRKRGSAGYELVAAELRGPGNSTTTESNSACNEALMIG
jgi:hypothetical protein